MHMHKLHYSSTYDLGLPSKGRLPCLRTPVHSKVYASRANLVGEKRTFIKVSKDHMKSVTEKERIVAKTKE